MKLFLSIFLAFAIANSAAAQVKTIHVMVALCDNVNQGIVPVPKSLGNGQDPASNLYWGAAYGVKSFFKNKTTDWKLVKTYTCDNPNILERLLFKHATKEVYMLADAYNGAKIMDCTIDFVKATNRQDPIEISYNAQMLGFGGKANLVAYIGHDGLMDFKIDVPCTSVKGKKADAIILACYSKHFFNNIITNAQANPILWTTHLMAPEAYTLKAAIDGWMLNETGIQIKERAAQSYQKYQKCGIKGARNLFVTGF